MATTLDPSLVELANTIDLDKVPGKIRCDKCHNFLLNPIKGLCCETTICEPCYLAANNACPECSVSPYSIEGGICKPNTSARKTVKTWLKNEAKARAAEAEKAKTPVMDSTPVAETPTADAVHTDAAGDAHITDAEVAPTAAGHEPELPDAPNDEAQSAEKVEENGEPNSDPTNADDDEVEIQVDPSQEDQEYIDQQMLEAQQHEEEYGNDSQQQTEHHSRPDSRDEQESPSKNGHFDMNNGQGYNNGNMDFQQMMQMMAGNGGMGFPMMNMMNPMQAMWNGFGGPSGGMNGMNNMNMGMGYGQNRQNPFQNNNNWQNSNPNAFSNGAGTDFNYGSNFTQNQNYPNGDFQNGYYGRGYGRGRGRGRGRGGYARGGNFQYQQNRYNSFQNQNDQQQQFDMQNMQSQMNHGRRHSRQEPPSQPKPEEPHPDDDEFAPGGQEEVQEALGDDYAKKQEIAAETAADVSAVDEAANGDLHAQDADLSMTEQNGTAEPNEHSTSFVGSPQPDHQEERKPIPAAYEEDLDMVMPPPTAPSGPSGRYGEKDYGFRARGSGRFSRNRGSIHLPNGHSPSSVTSVFSNTLPRPDSGEGVVGAPTGPRAMRDPPAKPTRQSSASGGFQIMGRASMDSTRIPERIRSPTPNGNDEPRPAEKPISRSIPRRDRDAGRLENETDDYGQDRRKSKSMRADYDDHEMQDAEKSYSRGSSRDRNKSHKSRRDRDKDNYDTDSRRSSRRYRDENADGDYDMNDYGEAVNGDRSRSHRKHRDEKYPRERERDRERDRDRDRVRDRDRDRERGRERPREKDRKRSRHDRDYDDDDDHDHERRHRSSKHHKKDHTKDLEINGRSNSHRSSQMPTPVATPTTKEADADPYAQDREAQRQARVLKEDQRRAKTANAKASGSGRRVSYKTEEDAQRGMEERESAMRAARWR